MLILCLDTSGSYLNIALCRERRVIAGISKVAGSGHSEMLSDELCRLIGSQDIKLNDIELLAVTTGPGSFTGLRVGIAFAKGLTAGLKLKTIPLNTLDAMAFSLNTDVQHLSPMIDAKKKEIYTALYDMRDGIPVRSGEYHSVVPQKWMEELPDKTFIFGSGEANYRDIFEKRSAELNIDKDFLASGKILSGMATLADMLLREGRIVEAEQLDAYYIRPADAELKQKSK
jgi:tRNA threonylcarbamoyladenosine biosynthesis protein TsaB